MTEPAGVSTYGQALQALGVAPRAGEDLIICRKNGNGGMKHLVYLDAWSAAPVQDDCYIATGRFRSGTVTDYKGRTEDNLVSVWALVVDADLKDRISGNPLELSDDALDEAREALLAEAAGLFDQTGLWPRLTLSTGYGLSFWWPLPDEDQPRVAEARALHKQLVAVLNHAAGRKFADPQVSDGGTRVMRLPGSLNTKNTTRPLQCVVLHEDDASWTLDTLQGAVSALPQPAIAAPIKILPYVDRSGQGSGCLSTDASGAIVREIAPYWTDGQRHDLALGIVGWLRRQDVPLWQAQRLVDDLIARSGGDAKDLHAVVRSTYAGERVAGWTKAREILPADVAQRIDDVLSAFWRAQQPSADPSPIVVFGGSTMGASTVTRSASARIKARSMRLVESRPVDWLWPRWLARGKLHLLGGMPGDGKSTIAAAIAATGARSGLRFWPDGANAPLFRTLFILGEDAPDDTLKPRLELHGLTGDDADNVMVFDSVTGDDGRERFFNAEKHAADLHEYIRDNAIDLVVIDPLSTAMAGKDRNAEGDVRDALTALTKVAENQNVAVLGIVHVGKPNGTSRTAQQRILGSTGFAAMARIVWQTSPAEDGLKALGVTKTNLAIAPPALLWRRDEDQPITWHGESSQSVDELMASVAGVRSPRANAEGFLLEILSGGMQLSTDVDRMAKEAGISIATLRRAKQAIGAYSWREPRTDGRWYVRLPTGQDQQAGERAAA